VTGLFQASANRNGRIRVIRRRPRDSLLPEGREGRLPDPCPMEGMHRRSGV